MMHMLSQALLADLHTLGSRSLAPLEVAVLDSGIDATHPDLVGRLVASATVETVQGEPVVVETTPNTNADVFGHGTAVASIIARLAPNARIVDVRVLDANNRGSGAALVEGLRWAVDRGSRLINMSLAVKADCSAKLWDLCERAYLQNQIVVAAQRNMPLMDYGFPAEFSSCISVGLEAFSDPFQLEYRPAHVIEYFAQGEEVTVAAAGGGYTTKTGTSFATPAVCGLCALLLGAFPDLRMFELKSILKAKSILELKS